MSKRTTVYQGHPSIRFEPGELVSCDWNRDGRVTVHRIMWKRTGVKGSQTGTVFCVKPSLGRKGEWIDATWFFKDGLEVL